MVFIAKVLLAALVIAFASWLSGKKPELSGFIIALPIASIIAIAFSYLEHKNTRKYCHLRKKYIDRSSGILFVFRTILFCQKLKYEFLDNLRIRHYSFNYWLFCS